VPAPEETLAVRTVDASACAAPGDLAAVLAADPAPALVLVASPEMEAQVLPLLRPQDDVARADADPAALAVHARRLSGRERAARELAQRRAHLEPLTGLPDRQRCLEWFGVDENAWTGERVRALLLLDIDSFQRCNHMLGREAGDHLLVDVARCLKGVAQPGDLIYRLELDEFVIVLERRSRELLVRDAEAFRVAVHAASCATVSGPAHMTASAGLAFLRATGFRYGALQQAEAAMYMAKILGRDTLVLHDDVRRLAIAHGTTLELSDLSEQADAAKERLASMAGEFNRRLLERAQREATIDPLTDVFNRRYLDTRLAREMARAVREAHPLSLVFFDIDDFRLVNHEYGHPTGDIALRRFTHLAGTCIRDADWLARYGGEEFCLVMPVGVVEARRVAERIREAVAKTPFVTLDGRPFAVTVSAGVVGFEPDHDHDVEHFVDRASKANRAAKDAGKNRVV
jgi:two-component system cell cycle response regulator